MEERENKTSVRGSGMFVRHAENNILTLGK